MSARNVASGARTLAQATALTMTRMDDSFLRAVEERFDRERPRWGGDHWKAKPFEGRWLELFPPVPGIHPDGTIDFEW